jgi:hydrogenase maturation protein HypF
MAISFLRHAFGPEFATLPIQFLKQIPQPKLRTLVQMLDRNVNSPLTSSCGRLFDAVAALAGVRHEINYEAQAAIELEMCRDDSVANQPYPFAVTESAGVLQLDPAPLIRAIVEDLSRSATPGQVSQRFHDSLVRALSEACATLRDRTSLNRVCLSGGTFQNAYLLARLEQQLRSSGFEVFSHSEVPAGDGGLSLGQAVVTAYRIAATA